MLTYTLSTTIDELRQILKLQQRNLASSVSEVEQKNEGFVTVQHDFELLYAMHLKCPHVIAKDDAEVIGYALSMHPNFGQRIEILKPMFEQIEIAGTQMLQQKEHSLSNFMVMGQICIAKDYRKQGVFRNLYNTMQTVLLTDYSAIITEVDAKNQRSLNAHYAVGFLDMSRYIANGQEWVLLYLK